MAQFEKIDTGNGFQNDLIATTNNRLELTILELQRFQKTTATELKLLQGDLRELKITIDRANKESNSLQNKFLWLTIIATAFTVLQVVQVVDILIRGVGK